MNSEEFTYLLQNKQNIDANITQQLNEVIEEFPYFQSARAIQLKGLNQTNSFKYNPALKKTAAYTIDRKILFEFITSKQFTNTSTEKISEEKINPNTSKTLAQENASEILEIGKPIKFNNAEPHSFNQWMQLISQNPIHIEENSIKKPSEIKEKKDLINKFIETNPKIKPINKSTDYQNITPNSSLGNESLMTETLAKVYLEQKKYESAVKAYRILSLKYPEKSGFFADRINAIKILQKNNS
jgi:hypothetical protein